MIGHMVNIISFDCLASVTIIDGPVVLERRMDQLIRVINQALPTLIWTLALVSLASVGTKCIMIPEFQM